MNKIYFSREGLEHFVKRAREFEKRSIERTTEEFEGASGGESSVYHDNFEYEQAVLVMDQRAREIKKDRDIISMAIVFDVKEQVERVTIGSTVDLELGDGTEKEVTIGAYGESFPEKGLVTYQSPLAKSILGKKEGEEGTIALPKGTTEVLILKIHPASYKYRKLIQELFSKP